MPLVARKGAAHKLVPLDIGLGLSQLDVQAEHLTEQPIESIREGRLAEGYVGIQLLAADTRKRRALFFWTREGGSSSTAEIDYLVPTRLGVLPVEVKSGSAGSLKSLHHFLADANGDLGVRLSSSPGGLENLRVRVRDRGTLTGPPASEDKLFQIDRGDWAAHHAKR
jgi:hypothetical protein